MLNLKKMGGQVFGELCYGVLKDCFLHLVNFVFEKVFFYVVYKTLILLDS